MITKGEQSVQNWMCGKCNELHDWFTTSTSCCKARSVRAYSDVRCRLCLDDLPGWNLYDDGVTRPCPCSTGMIGGLPGQPNLNQRDTVSAYVLSQVFKSISPRCFPTIVPRRASQSERSTP